MVFMRIDHIVVYLLVAIVNRRTAVMMWLLWLLDVYRHVIDRRTKAIRVVATRVHDSAIQAVRAYRAVGQQYRRLLPVY